MTAPSGYAIRQYGSTTDNLAARIALHAFGTNPQDWFSWLDERLPRSGDVLEVGAGTGRLWSRIDPAGLRLTLTDFSAAMCSLLGRVAGARVLRCAATSLPFRTASFDTVIANHMLYHVDQPAVALREFARVLRPGGRLAVATNGRGHLAELDALAVAIGLHVESQTTFSDFSDESGPALVAAEFSDVVVERYPCDLEVTSVAPVLAALASLGAPLTSAQAATARSLVEASLQARGSFRIAKHTLLITATR